MSSKDLDDLFRENLSGRAFEPSYSAWEHMEQLIADEQFDGFVKSKLDAQTFTPSRNAWRRVASELPGNTSFWTNSRRMAAAIATTISVAGATTMLWPTDEAHLYAERQELVALEELSIDQESFEIKNDASITNSDQASLLTASNSTNAESLVADQSGDITNDDSQILAANQNTGSTQITDNAYSNTHTLQETTSQSAANQLTSIASKATSSAGLVNSLSQDNSRDYSGMEADEAIFETTTLKPKSLFLSLKSGLINIIDNDDEQSTIPSNTIHVKEIPKRKGVIKHTLGVIGGVNLAQGYAGGDASGSSNGNLFGGISYNYFLAPKWVIHADLLYQSRKGVGTSKVLAAKTYHFGSASDVLTMHNKTMNYLELPVSIGYRFARDWQVTAGTSVSYLLACDNEMVHEHHGTFDSWTTTESETSRPEGMQSIDVALSAGLVYEVLPQLELGTRLNYGLMDVTDNEYFQQDITDNNVQLRFHIAYRFLTF